MSDEQAASPPTQQQPIAFTDGEYTCGSFLAWLFALLLLPILLLPILLIATMRRR
ncbi:MAG: hypothetical protein JST33_01050 [Actinobacteria bacterium]|nr:hypothetical protein [Actinomycetota bacterium]